MSGMEALLMGDSSSGESDDEVNVPMGTPAAAAGAAVPAPAPPAPAPAPPPRQPAPAPAPKANSNADQMARLKSLYDSQPKRQPAGSATSTPQQPSTSSNRPPSASQAPAPAPVRPLMPNRPHHQSMPGAPQQQPQQHHAQPVPQQQQHQHQPQQQHHSQHMPPQQQHYSHSTSKSSSQHHPPDDPFAPTPLHRIKERHQQKQQISHSSQPPSSHPTQQPHMQQRSMPSSSSAPSNRTSQPRAPVDRAAMERDIRKQKEKFLMFTRVLIKYLEQKDPNMHQQAKMIIKDCAERNKRQEPGYESVTASMKERLKKLVGEQYWKRAEAYLKHFLEQKNKTAGGSSSNSNSQQPAPGSSVPPGSSQQRHGYPSSSHASHPSSSSSQRHTEQEKARQQQQQTSKARTSATPQQPAPTIANLRQEIANKRQAISSASPKTATPAPAPTTTPTTPSGKAAAASKKASSSKRKSGSSTPTSASRKTAAPPAATPAAGPSPEQPPEPEELPPREYTEFMEMLDHAVDYDWSSAGLLLGSKNDLQLSEEQKNLLYGETNGKPKPADPVGALRGWGKRNLLSERAAWARVRLREHKGQRPAPVVGGGLLTLPGGVQSPPPADTAWVNEEKAEQDTTLAMLSESCEIYIRGVLEKAIHCARQRQNLDGIRLWHRQHSTASNTTKPPLAVRLGCDVSRQVAQAAGNAAMTCKRMEEALERQNNIPSRERVLKDETLTNATSMADLAMRPLLAKGVENADYHGKRSFEISGGKRASEPPLGRVPKMAKLEVADFVMGSCISDGVGRHRAGTASSSIYF